MIAVDCQAAASEVRALLARGVVEGEEVARVRDAWNASIASIANRIARCRPWLERGLVAEAVGFAEDSRLLHDVAALSLGDDHARWAALCEAAGVGAPAALDRAELDAIEVAVARFARIRAPLVRWRRVCLDRRGVFERLESLRAVRGADPQNAVIGSMLRELETEAIRSAPSLLEEAESLGDIETLASARSQLCEGRWMRALPTGLADAAVAAHERAILAAAAAELDDLEARIHGAASAMDESELRSLREEWVETFRRLGLSGEPGRDERVRESFAWLDALDAGRATEQSFEAARVHLARVLDEQRPVDEIEAAYAAAARFDRALPRAIDSQVAARFAQARDTARRRSRLLMLSVAALVLAATVVTVLALTRSAERRRLDGLAASIESMLDENRVPEARELVTLLPEGAPQRSARLLAAVASTATAAADWDAQRSEIAARIASASAMLARPEATIGDAELQTLGAELADARRRATETETGELARLDSLRAGIVAQRTEARRSAARAAWSELRAELGRRITPARWTNAERTSVRRWDEYREESARLRTAVAALEPDAGPAERAEIGVELRRLDADLSAIERRIEAMHAARDLLEFLDEPPADEDAYAARITADLATVGAVLAEIGQLGEIERVADAARAGRGVRHWREVVVPRERRARTLAGMADGAPWRANSRAAAIELASAIGLHEQTHPDSPYQRVAAAMRAQFEHQAAEGAGGAAGATGSAAGRGDALVDAIRALGYEDLHRTPLRGGGFIYVRPGAGPFDRALTSRRDLRTPAERLAPRADPGLVPAGATTAVPLSAALATALPTLSGRSGIELAEAWLEVIDAVEQAAADEPVMAVDLLTQLWQLWRDLGAGPGDPLVALTEPWLRTAQGRWRDALIFDWAARSNDPRSSAASAARGAAEAALAALPNRAARVTALSGWWNALVEGLEPVVPAGALLVADADGVRRAPEFGADGTGVVIVPRPGERGRFMFATVRITDGEGIVEGGQAPAEATMLFRRPSS